MVRPGAPAGPVLRCLVTRSRLHAVRYKLAVDKILAERGYPFKALVAFSGTVQDGGQSYTESGMNGFPEAHTAKTFEQPEYRLLIVANKFQTGFDQPLLHTMYVDKKLGGVNAVQTRSRLNRTHPEQKGALVLDFANESDEIKAAFEPYYETTLLSEATNPNLLYEIQTRLGAFPMYGAADVEAFAKVYFESDDRFMRHLAQVVRNGMGDRARTCIDPKTQIVQGKTVCAIEDDRRDERCSPPVRRRMNAVSPPARRRAGFNITLDYPTLSTSTTRWPEGHGGGTAASLDDPGNRVQVVRTPTKAVYSRPIAGGPGHLLFLRDRALLAQRFDARAVRLEGDPVPLASDIAMHTSLHAGAFWSSDTGLLVYRSGIALERVKLTWMSRTGERLASAGPDDAYTSVRISPDGRRAALGRRDPLGGDIWVLEFGSERRTRFTFDPQMDGCPVWSPDGRQIAFSSDRTGVRQIVVGACRRGARQRAPRPVARSTPCGRASRAGGGQPVLPIPQGRGVPAARLSV